MDTPTNTDILTLAQWFSPAYPVGGFAYSHGLEWAIESGQVRDASDTGRWITDVLRFGAGWNDCLFLVAAFRAGGQDEVADIDATCRAFAPSRERLQESVLQGEAFCTITAAVWSADINGLSYPVAVGRAAKLAGLPIALTTQMFAQAFISNLVAASMRLVPLGQTEGQILIRDLTPLCVDIAITAMDAGLDDLQSSAFLSDIASMKHETQYSRIFRT